jgi:polar amino acid transport system substrate-binding protein
MRFSHLAAFGLALAVLIGASPAVLAGKVLDRITETGVIRVATDPAWPPFSWRDEKGNWQGFDPSVAEEIGKRMGVRVEFVTPPWESITSGNWKGEWDISIGGMSPTEDRAKNLSFPAIYTYSPSVLAVHRDNDKILSPSDARGKRIGVLKGSIFEKYTRREPMGMANEPPPAYKIEDPVVVTFETSEAASDELAKGSGAAIDAMVDDVMYFLHLIKRGAPLRIVGQPLYYGPAAVAIEPGDAEFEKLLADMISAMHADGTLTGLSNRWFGVDLTRKF